MRKFARAVVVALAFVAALSFSPCVSRAKETLGLISTKPESGPFAEFNGQFMVPYAETIPGTDISFEMIPVPGGEFQLGSPPEEARRNQDENPQTLVRVDPFWIGKTEVTWAEYHEFMRMYKAFKDFQTLVGNPEGKADVADEDRTLIEQYAWSGNIENESDIDAVTSPTPLYAPDTTYMAGDSPNQPAVTMTQYSARQYTKWLSGLTGREYRLPGEAEWEYAARAGTTTAYSFGADPSDLDQYAWFADNSDYVTHQVATKKPNPWGLYDMHGNVAEWTLDQYAMDRYEQLAPGPVNAWDSINWPKDVIPRVIRGGSWLDDAPMLRSAARHKSEEDDWKLSDPNLPLSPWWYTEEPAMGVGMRLVRSPKPLKDDEKKKVWDADVEELQQAVASRLKEGRGALGRTGPELHKAVEAAKRLSD